MFLMLSAGKNIESFPKKTFSATNSDLGPWPKQAKFA